MKKFEVWEISKEWIEGKVPAGSLKGHVSPGPIGEVFASSLVDACPIAQKKFPGKNLRVADDKHRIEFPFDAPEMPVEVKQELYNVTFSKE